MNRDELRRRLADPVTRAQAALELGDWVRQTCLLMGAGLNTAIYCGSVFAVGIAKEWGEETYVSERAARRPRRGDRRTNVPGSEVGDG